MSYEQIAETARGVKTDELRKILLASNQEQFYRELKKCLCLLNQFGLTLRYFADEDKWYLLAETKGLPHDIGKAALETLAAIYLGSLEGKIPSTVVLAKNRGVKEETISLHFAELEKQGYLLKSEKGYELSQKTRKNMCLRRYTKNGTQSF